MLAGLTSTQKLTIPTQRSAALLPSFARPDFVSFLVLVELLRAMRAASAAAWRQAQPAMSRRASLAPPALSRCAVLSPPRPLYTSTRRRLPPCLSYSPRALSRRSLSSSASVGSESGEGADEPLDDEDEAWVESTLEAAVSPTQHAACSTQTVHAYSSRL